MSQLLRRAGLDAARVKFSCPGEPGVEEGVVDGRELPLSGALISALFKGLLGDARARVRGLEGEDFFAERSESLTLGRKGVPNIDW